MPEKQAADLPGYRKKSFLLYYNGGEIWFEHLDSLYGNEALVIEKLNADVPLFIRPSASAFVCFVFHETVVTEPILLAVQKAVLETEKRFTKIAFCGLDRKSRKKLQKALRDRGFGIAFFDGLEEAKTWLLP